MIKNLKNKKKGFTLIELIIVIAIIAILAAVAIPKFGEVRKNAALKTDIANAKTIANAVTALIAEEKLITDATSITPLVVDNDTSTLNTNEVEAYMQNPPSPESKGYVRYEVVVDDDGNVSITMTDGVSTSTNLFPVPATEPEVVPPTQD